MFHQSSPSSAAWINVHHEDGFYESTCGSPAAPPPHPLSPTPQTLPPAPCCNQHRRPMLTCDQGNQSSILNGSSYSLSSSLASKAIFKQPERRDSLSPRRICDLLLRENLEKKLNGAVNFPCDLDSCSCVGSVSMQQSNWNLRLIGKHCWCRRLREVGFRTLF